ncbi:hypothetical protein [Terrabacter sp. 2RAF25]|uniref:hypothetical protein n=1 Tax=Terrabacter sp. 2RAF25 TaxID=3232998 RepID=UPI003F9708FA
MGFCEPDLPLQEGARAFFRADTYYDRDGGFEAQLTARFPNSTLARRAVERIVAHRTDCDSESTDPQGPWSSSDLRRTAVGRATAVAWTTTPTKKVGPETTVVVRSGAFVSVVVVHGSDRWRDDVVTDSLAAASAARLP